jgi:hypothetical protein
MTRRPPVPCAYCASTMKPSNDHVPPENLFPRPRRGKLITVPCCRECNVGFSKDDEYFRLALALHPRAHTNPDAEAARQSTARSFGRVSATWFTESIRFAIRKVPGLSRAGLFLGTTDFLTIDMARVNRTVERITRALYYHHRGERVPPGYGVAPMYLRGFNGPRRSDEQIQNENRFLIHLIPAEEQRLGGTTFCYWYRELPGDPKAVAWQMEFFGFLTYLSIVCPVGNEA